MGSGNASGRPARRGALALAAVAALAAALALVGWPRAAQAENRCLECHAIQTEPRLSDPAKKYLGSVHRDDAIGCAGCHGGNPSDPTAGGAHSVDEGYVAHPPREKVAGVCGGCHSDARFVRRFNASLPIDQLTLFGASRHGVLVAAGDPSTPTCTSCHGTHDIVPTADPRSPVHRRNVAELCAGCHADPKKMSSWQGPTDQLAKWSRSAHADALHRGDGRAPSCAGCHGSHGDMPARVTSIAKTCGTCHTEELNRFRESPHNKPFARLGFAECVPCHGSHDVPAARPLLLGLGPDGACEKCHSKDDKPREVIQRLSERLRGAEDRAARARAELARAASQGLYIPRSTAALADLRTAELHLLPSLHAFDEAALEAPIAEVTGAADAAEKLVALAENERKVERRGYMVTVAITFALFGLLLLKTARLARRRAP